MVCQAGYWDQGPPQPVSIRYCLRNFRAPSLPPKPPLSLTERLRLLETIFLDSYRQMPYKKGQDEVVLRVLRSKQYAHRQWVRAAQPSLLQPQPQNYAGAFKSQVLPAWHGPRNPVMATFLSTDPPWNCMKV